MVRNQVSSRAPKRPKHHLRAAVLAAGHELLIERGLEGGATSVSLHAAIARAADNLGERVTPASVYGRIWESQSSFQNDVLLTAARGYPAGEEAPTADAAFRVISAADRSTPAARKAALHEVWCVAGSVHVGVLEASRSWQLWVGVWALTVSTPSTADDEVLGPALRQGDESATGALRDLLAGIIDSLGHRARSPFTVDDFAVAVACLAEGFALRERFGGKQRMVTLPVGEVAMSWTPFAAALRALASDYLEPVPRWKPARLGERLPQDVGAIRLPALLGGVLPPSVGATSVPASPSVEVTRRPMKRS